MKRISALLTLFIAALLSPGALAQPHLAGSDEVQLALDKLNVLGSVLMIAAHPDDENTALLAYLARGRKYRTGYLSLTRGEGGQNLIGPEQGHLLGIIRTQELLAAREIDGAEQFFTRAMDFGFTKSAEETFDKWGREQVLGDIVRVIRKFRPDVIVLRFSGTPRDGHGQHQASAILGKDAFAAAADPKRFPEQLQELEPWQAKRIVWNVFAFNREQEAELAALPGKIEVDLGEYDPLLGYSYAEIAGISRSMHRSQAMGSPERRGSWKNYFVHVSGQPARKDLFDDIGTGWDRVEGGTSVGQMLAAAARSLDPKQPSKVVPALLEARTSLSRLSGYWAKRKVAELDDAIALSTGLWLDANADRPVVSPGSPVRITARAVNRSAVEMHWEAVTLEGAPGAGAMEADRKLAYNVPADVSINWQAAAGTRTQPVESPEPPPVLTAVFNVRVGTQSIHFARPVSHRYVSPIYGERTRPLEVVPPASVEIASRNVLFPDTAPKMVDVHVRSWTGKASGSVHLQLPPGWKAEPAGRKFELAAQDGQAVLQFQVQPPDSSSDGTMAALAKLGDSEIWTETLTLSYPHIELQTILQPAAARVVRTPVEVANRDIGYVMGAGDNVPEALTQMGCRVTMLSADDLSRGDLNRFGAIVTGVRAYNTRPELRANHDRLMTYVRNGGTLVVQYNVAERGESNVLDQIGPYPIEIGRSRVSVEEAPVAILKPGSPLLTFPNRIIKADFEGWVQERGLYFASKWDPKYTPVIASSDPGEEPLAGGMLYTRYGKGVYVFTAYSWFRQLPAGVPGAYRIFANLLSAGKADAD
jgi:LmbE family N-acetylglucosaminyl deacetylase